MRLKEDTHDILSQVTTNLPDNRHEILYLLIQGYALKTCFDLSKFRQDLEFENHFTIKRKRDLSLKC